MKNLNQIKKILTSSILMLMIAPIIIFAQEHYIKSKNDLGKISANQILVRLKPGDYSNFEKSSIFIQSAITDYKPLLRNQASLKHNINLRNSFIMSSNNANINFDEAIKAEDKVLRTFIAEVPEGIHPQDYCIQIMRTNPYIELAEPYYIHDIMVYYPDDPFVHMQDVLTTLQAFEAWAIEMGNPEVVIGISDNAILQYHEDLINSIALNTAEVANTNEDNDGNGYIDDYMGYNFAAESGNGTYGSTYNEQAEDHGTQVAGIAAATSNNTAGIAGIANRCKMFPMRTSIGGRSIDFGYQSIIYAAVRGFKVLNLSWGSPRTYSDIEQSIINYAVSLDVAIVASSGNQRSGVDIYSKFYPAGYYGVLGVGEVNGKDEVTVGQSVLGITAEILAQGHNILTTVQAGGYDWMGYGTSYSAPVVSGVVALVRSRFPELSAMQALEHTRQSTDVITIDNENLKGFVPGRVNMLKAVSTEPFSRPGIRPRNYEYRNSDNVVVNRFLPEDEVILYIDIHNYLGKAENLEFKLSTILGRSNSVSLIEDKSLLTELETMQTGRVGPFRFKINKVQTEPIIFRMDIADEFGYTDHFRFDFVPTVDFMTFSNNSILFSISDNGEFGFSTASGDTRGNGFNYNDLGNQLYANSGIIASAGDSKLVSYYFADFTAEKQFLHPEENINIISDNSAPSANKVGIEIKQKVNFVNDDLPVSAINIEVKNKTAGPINDLAVGYFIDWDIAGDEDNNKVSLLDIPFIPEAPLFLGNIAAMMAEYIEPYPVFGMAIYSEDLNVEPQAAGLHYGQTRNFTRAMQHQALNSGTQMQTDTIYDISALVGMRFIGATYPEEVRKCLFCIGAGETKEELEGNLRECILVFGGVSVNKTITENDFRIYPNPASDYILIRSSNNFGEKIKIVITDLLGNEVLRHEFYSKSVNDVVSINISELPQSVYFITQFSEKNPKFQNIFIKK